VSNHRHTFSLTLTLRSPFLFRGLDGALLGVDAAYLRDERGRPIIPADQIRGVLREALGDLVSAGVGDIDLNTLFGRASGNEDDPGATNAPERGTLIFADLVAEAPTRRGVETTRVEIDDDLGAVKRGALQIIELVAPFGALVRFEGRFILFAPKDRAKALEKRFQQALRLVSSIGAFKSPGFGEVVPDKSFIKLESSKPLVPPSPVDRGGDELQRLRVRFDRPILVDSEKIADNAILGSPVVPGAAVKGALARRLVLAGLSPEGEGDEIGAALSELSVSHAFPESETAGVPFGLPLPLSLIAAKVDGRMIVKDALGVPRGRGAMICGEPGIFATDWKDGFFPVAAAALGRPRGETPPGLSRTHTRIGDKGAAADGALFTTIARSVASSDGRDRTWLLDVDLGRVGAGRVPLARGLVALLLEEGLDGVGSTGAHAAFEPIGKADPPAVRPIAGERNRYAVVSLTPALMLDPATLWDKDGNWMREPMEAYADYWAFALPGAKLRSVFASQELMGGYIARRRRLHGASTYFPFLLTSPGSVFDIETDDVDGLRTICRYGLPPRAPSNAEAPLDWRNCPYLRENGYGRVSADHLSAPERRELREGVEHV